MSGDFAHTHLVSKLMASWLMRGVLQTPPAIGTQRTWGSRVGVVVAVGAWLQVDHRGSCVWRGVGGISISWCRATFVMGGTDPGTLFHVLCMCVRFVKRSVHLVVGLGAAIMGGTSVMRCITGWWRFCVSSHPLFQSLFHRGNVWWSLEFAGWEHPIMIGIGECSCGLAVAVSWCQLPLHKGYDSRTFFGGHFL